MVAVFNVPMAGAAHPVRLEAIRSSIIVHILPTVATDDASNL